MQNAAVAYNETTKITEDARDREASLLIKAASELQQAVDRIDDRSAARSALQFNRKLWTVFVTSVTSEENPLPQEIKENVASLGVFILTQTLDAMINPDAEKLTPLISINRNIAAGLRGQA